MTISAEVLRQLHRLHQQLSDVRARLKRGPKQVQAAEANVERLKQEVAAAKEAVIRSRVTTDDKELQLKQREARIADLRLKLNGCNTNKEYQALLEQIAADEQANSVLSDEILELFEKTAELQEKLKNREGQLATAEGELAKLKQRVSGDRHLLETDLGRLTQELAGAETTLPADFRLDYDRIVKARGEHALAPVEDEVCGGCFTTITSQMQEALRLSRPVFCKSCGCLLYIPEDRSPGP